MQGAYFAFAGLWPLVHMSSFVAVTGPKTDLWLVQTVGVLVLAIGVALLLAAWRGPVRAETVALAVGSAVGLAALDVVHVAEGTIRAVYLADAAVELALVVAWGVFGRARSGADLDGHDAVRRRPA